MIVVLEQGRLGNQLFKLAALQEYFPGEKYLCLGCEALRDAVDPLPCRVINMKDKSHWVQRFVRLGLCWGSDARLFGVIDESQDDEVHHLRWRKGLCRNFSVTRNAYFQHAEVINDIHPRFSLKEEVSKEAESWLEQRSKCKPGESKVFVHIRRGDYLQWPSPEYPAVLSAAWYERAMVKIKSHVHHAHFIVVSDDTYYAQDIFGHRNDVSISDNSQVVDLALMSSCDHGILSASSFAWWGAWFARQRGKKTGNALFVAPMYWGGHRKSAWHPKGFGTPWLTFLD